jgi:hypothetical protein
MLQNQNVVTLFSEGFITTKYNAISVTDKISFHENQNIPFNGVLFKVQLRLSFRKSAILHNLNIFGLMNTLARLSSCDQYMLIVPFCASSLSLSRSFLPVTPTLEHRAFVKRFVSLQFLNLKPVARTPWTGDQPVARPLPNTNTE